MPLCSNAASNLARRAAVVRRKTADDPGGVFVAPGFTDTSRRATWVAPTLLTLIGADKREPGTSNLQRATLALEAQFLHAPNVRRQKASGLKLGHTHYRDPRRFLQTPNTQ